MSLYRQIQQLPLSRTGITRGFQLARQSHSTSPRLQASPLSKHSQPTVHQSKSTAPQQTRSFRTTSRRREQLPSRLPNQPSSQPPPPPPPPKSPSPPPATRLASPSPTTRLDRVLSRLPPSLQKHTSRLRAAPVSHVIAFLILHELTAIVPLLALFGLFHYSASGSNSDSDSDSNATPPLIPLGYMLEHYGSYVQEGVAKFERYFTRKGWFGFGGGGQQGEGEGGAAEAVGQAAGAEAVLRRWESSDGKYRILVEVALAYALTKALLPVRIAASVWATPWFAGVIARVRSVVTRTRR